jgi:hypothetical protein
MTDQSIEGERKRFEYDFSGRLNLERLNLPTPSIGFDTDYADSNTNFAWIGYQAARQSSQSEPFAYINPLFLELKEKGALGAEIAFFKPSDRCLPIYLAAPQQAIPSGLSDDTIHELIQKYHPKCLKGVKTKFEVTDWWRFAKAIEKALSASPTAPIERDK